MPSFIHSCWPSPPHTHTLPGHTLLYAFKMAPGQQEAAAPDQQHQQHQISSTNQQHPYRLTAEAVLRLELKAAKHPYHQATVLRSMV